MKKEGLVVKVVSFVVVVVFFWTNCVWAGGFGDFKLAASSRVTALVPVANEFAIGQGRYRIQQAKLIQWLKD